MSERSKEANEKRSQFWKNYLKEWSQTGLSQNAYCRNNHPEHGRPDYMFWSLASMVTTKEAIWESRTPPDYSSKSPDHDYDQGFLRLNSSTPF